MKVSDILRMLSEDGWYLASTKGSHRQFKHPSKPGRVTVAGKPSDDLAPGTLNSILNQSGLKNRHPTLSAMFDTEAAVQFVRAAMRCAGVLAVVVRG